MFSLSIFFLSLRVRAPLSLYIFTFLLSSTLSVLSSTVMGILPRARALSETHTKKLSSSLLDFSALQSAWETALYQ
ncbi:hypothetical protein QBC35DRAFT_502751 [Podospora australis]|uniref:Uncharacterized protein n=1 Tax=Podospora australis TaxID=1536484 RepID=A0AAN6WPU3_9PEZI|nr:hypothetical protein QBC35DRAFT_502751 [Podospora australis]